LVNYTEFDANGRYQGAKTTMKVQTVANQPVGIITKESVTA
jgi:hypothetical protein